MNNNIRSYTIENIKEDFMKVSQNKYQSTDYEQMGIKYVYDKNYYLTYIYNSKEVNELFNEYIQTPLDITNIQKVLCLKTI
jgi:hypothetical protein